MSPTPSEIIGGRLPAFRPDADDPSRKIDREIRRTTTWVVAQLAAAESEFIKAGLLHKDMFFAGLIAELVGSPNPFDKRLTCLHPVYGQPDRSTYSQFAPLYAAAGENYSHLFPLQSKSTGDGYRPFEYKVNWTTNPAKNRIDLISPSELSSAPAGLHFLSSVISRDYPDPLLQEIVTSLIDNQPIASSDNPTLPRLRELAAWETLQLAICNTAKLTPPRPSLSLFD